MSVALEASIPATIVRHGRYIVFQMAEVAIPKDLSATSL
jgi:hypothetical protein